MGDKSNDHPLIDRAIKIAGSQAALAAACGCAQQHISKLLNRRISITAEMAVAIERATGGGVTRAEMRPDLWQSPLAADEAAA